MGVPTQKLQNATCYDSGLQGFDPYIILVIHPRLQVLLEPLVFCVIGFIK